LKRSLDLATLDRVAVIYLSGGCAYFVLMRFGNIPTLGAIISSFAYLLIVGACLRLWVARESKNPTKFWSTVALLPVLPAVTMLKDGFIGFGTYWALAIMSFTFAGSKRRFGYLLVAPAVVFVGISIFANYMLARNDLRSLVWIQQVELGERLQRVQKMFEEFEWINLSNPQHRAVIDGRLNQNYLVGVAVARLESGQVEYAFGTTVRDMIIGLIPRAVWPDKPGVGGGGSVVRDFTGLEFQQGTSVGAGQVLEFYANFGTWGVIGGFLIYGFLIGWMDIRVMECLHRGNRRGYLLWFMICVAMLQPGGNLLEIVVSAASSAVAAYSLSYLVDRVLPVRKLPSDSSGLAANTVS
jgi:hypothetical protein